jgi:hypothetical protein
LSGSRPRAGRWTSTGVASSERRWRAIDNSSVRLYGALTNHSLMLTTSPHMLGVERGLKNAGGV